MFLFVDRHDAGRKLAVLLAKYKDDASLLIIGLPRGGVVVAYEVARSLQKPFDVICPRKVGAPFNPELALGAVTETGEGYFNDHLIASLGVSKSYIEKESQKEQRVAKMRLELFRKGKDPLSFKDKTVIIIDDGLATGATMKAAIQSIKSQKPKKLVVAVPVSPPDTANEISQMCDEFIALSTPWQFQAVGQFYEDFGQTDDDEVVELLQRQPRE